MTGPRLSIIPARAATDRALKPRDLQVLCVLGRHTDDLGWCRKSQVKMAAEMDCARSTVFEAIERLVQAGYLERHVQIDEVSGRDSPHVYRVILDPVHPDPESIQETGFEPANEASTPAGISAPLPVYRHPPAGPGPAPKNDPLRTNLREGAREPEDQKKIDAEGWALLKDWPGFAGMPKEPALKVWRSLTPDERAEASRKFPAWLALLKAQHKSHVPAPSTYFGQKLFREVAEPSEAKPLSIEARPFGKLWQAARLKQLISEPMGFIPGLTSFEQQLVDTGKAKADELRREKRMRFGWPQVNGLHEAASVGKSVSCAPALEPLASLMAQVRVGSEEFEAWKVEHQLRGWPWLPDPGRQEWVYFPAGGPVEGLKAFEAAVRGNNADGSAEAAE